jgi:zinc transport system substrate-binding protein
MNFGDSLLNCFKLLRGTSRAQRTQLSKLSPKFLALLLVTSTAALAEAPKVVASFKPVHSLVASVMQGVGEPYLLVKGPASPHTYALTPTDAAAIEGAKAIFWIGPDMEAFLEKTVDALGRESKAVALEGTPGLTKLPLREGGAFDGHEEDGAAHDHGGTDPHIWLDPDNAKLMVEEIENTLREIDPANADAYKANAAKTLTGLDALTNELSATLSPIKDKPFITFHDAFHYFEKRFGLTAAGSIAINPDAAPGAARVAELQAKVKELGAVCLFSEPNFEPKLINVIAEGSAAKTGALDPEASGIAEGPDLYFQSLRELAAAMRACLSD